MGNPKYHTFDECLVKVKAIKTLLEQIRRASTEPDTATSYAVADSAIQLCDELVREGDSDSGIRCS